MAQFKIYGHITFLDQNRLRISDALHQASIQELKLPADKKFHRFLGLASEDFIYPADRSEKYLIIEIQMFSGRTEETIKNFIKAMISNLGEFISTQDIEISVTEIPKYAWGIRGKTGDELVLNYKVEV